MSNKTKKYLKLFTSFALVAAIAVGVTLAALSTITETKTNKFTSSNGITGTIEEEDWDKEYGKDGWTDYLPGESTAKTPIITIESKDSDVDVAVAMKVVCLDNDGNKISVSQFEDSENGYGELLYNGVKGLNLAKWEKGEEVDGTTGVDGYTMYYYKDTLTSTKTGVETEPLFTEIKINSGIKRVYNIETTTESKTVKVYKTNPDGSKGELIKEVEDEPSVTVNSTDKVFTVVNGVETEVTGNVTLPKFEIKVTGYATQVIEDIDSKTELAKLAGIK